jgi:D-glycero-alpha-D-manno-heptose 1-phosphate guanylyltransferase
MKMLILAGGFGTRLHSVVEKVPKALAPVDNLPFLHYQLAHWIAQGIRSFVFLLHHQADQIIAFLESEKHTLLKDCSFSYAIEAVPLDTGGAIANAVKILQLTDDFLVTNADTWLGSGINDMLHSQSPSMAVVNVTDTGRYGQVQFGHQSNVLAFREKNSSREPGWINAGLCRLPASLFAQWDGLSFSLERKIFPQLVDAASLKAVTLRCDFIDIGVPDDYFRFCNWIETGRKGQLCN